MPFLIVFLMGGAAIGHYTGLNIIAMALVLYFLPTLVAMLRRRSPFAVAFLNTSLGWTGVGWFISMLWALA
jgi:membrane protease YdiL (CAAX protease family)